MDIKSDVEVDQYHLESECITMSSTYYNYADMAREAKSLVSEKADALKVIQAERNIAIRENCSNEGKRVTEGIITSMVQCDPEVVQAMKELRDANATFERISVGVKALEIKKSELDNLVKLRCNGMYVENVAKPTQEIKDETISHFNQRTQTPLPKRGE